MRIDHPELKKINLIEFVPSSKGTVEGESISKSIGNKTADWSDWKKDLPPDQEDAKTDKIANFDKIPKEDEWTSWWTKGAVVT